MFHVASETWLSLLEALLVSKRGSVRVLSRAFTKRLITLEGYDISTKVINLIPATHLSAG